jgi:hypothetical protein
MRREMSLQKSIGTSRAPQQLYEIGENLQNSGLFWSWPGAKGCGRDGLGSFSPGNCKRA